MDRIRLAIFGSIPFLLVKHLRVTGKDAMEEEVPKLTRSAWKQVLECFLQENQCLGHAGIERKRIFAGDKEEGDW